MVLIKLMFFADRYHLRHYSILITADDYKAMKLGPVGSATKDILKYDEFFFSNLTSEDKRYYRKYLKLEGDYVKANGICNYKELSESEKEALDFAIKFFGKFGQFRLAHITHDYPEWKQYKEFFDKYKAKRIDMNEIDFLDDPIVEESPYIQKYLDGEDPFREDEEILKNIREDLLEQCSSNYWSLEKLH